MSWDLSFAMSENKQTDFDFSAPLSRHPNDVSVDTEDLIKAGILTIEDFKCGKTAISSKQYADFRRKFKNMDSSGSSLAKNLQRKLR